MKIVTAREAANQIKDNATISTGGFVGCNIAETVLAALEERYIETQHPKDVFVLHAAAQGDKDFRAVNHFGHEGMLKRIVAGHYNFAPKLIELITANKIEAYNFPQGTLSQLFREIAGKRLGVITHVGLNTFADPRNGGGKLNSKTTEDLVELVEIGGETRLLYKAHPVDVAIIRGTWADERGNIAMSKEAVFGEVTAIAQAAKNSGGIVIAQVERVVKSGSLNPQLVKIPGFYVDYVVEAGDEEGQDQCFGIPYDASLSGEIQIPVEAIPAISLNERKVIGRRAAMELMPDSVVNLGIGMPEAISAVANEEGIGDYMTLTVEAGPNGGVPQGGNAFGASINPECILDQPTQFDFYDGGGLDMAFLGLAQADEQGNINVSKFGTRIPGCGGFINITQNTKKVYFIGTFTAKGLKVEVKDGKLNILQEGSNKKFIKNVEHITFSGEYAVKTNQPVTYITERAVFELKPDGMHLTEIAPGVNLEKDILAQMDFEPKISPDLKEMDPRIFADDIMGLKK